MFEKRLPDLILLDVEMPVMNGYQTLELIKTKEDTRDIPVIFLTAQSDVEDELKGFSLGAVDYITKPFSPPLLLKRIENQLLVISQRQELVNFNKNLQEMVEAKTKTVIELKDSFMKTMAELVEIRDYVTGGHIERTQVYLGILLDAIRKNGLYAEETSSWDIDLIVHSAQLHDIGKIGVEDTILRKKGSLTTDEFEEIKRHVTTGEDFIDKIKKIPSEREFLEQARVLIATHHEKWDGSGYPRGLKGRNIPLQGRLMAIADVYDALVSDRPYRKAIQHNEVVDIIIGSREKHFDPELVDLFKSISDKFSSYSGINNAIIKNN